MRIAIATDAWVPQVNGVVRTLTMTVQHLLERGYEVELIVPDRFMTLPLPGYREIRLAVAPKMGVRRAMRAFMPDVVHIVTEGPIGWSVRRWCIQHNVPFTTAFHTRFPDYASARTGLSPDWFWPIMLRFHAGSRAVFVSTERLRGELANRGMGETRLWSRGVDTSIFHPDGVQHPRLTGLPRPLLLSVGRVAVEKNLDAFLGADVAGTKIVVGDGPALTEMKRRYPTAVFMGALKAEELASAYRAADVFVFPSKTDTFGLVMIEALACGAPVAGFPVAGPLDIVGQHHAPSLGALHEDLATAIGEALQRDRSAAAVFGAAFRWDKCTDQFVAGLQHALGADRQDAMAPLSA